MPELTEKEERAKDRVCLALDVSGTLEALVVAHELSGYVGVFKIGKELHIAAGNAGENIIKGIYRDGEGGKVFLDLKLHDTPNTVYKASMGCAEYGVYMFNLHISGGEAMCKKAIEGAKEGAKFREIRVPKVIGVTELTSLNDDDLKVQGLGIGYSDLVRRRTELAVKWGLDGIVCPANQAGALEKEFGSQLLYVTPGIEYGGKKGEGQKQLYTPDLAVRDCKNSILVIGSAITKAKDKRATAYEILQTMTKEL